MSKKQIYKMILVIAAVGVTMTAGTLCGYVLSKALYDIGAFYMAFQFPVIFAFAYADVLIVVPFLIIMVL